MAIHNWVYGVANENNAHKIKIKGASSDQKALDDSYYARYQYAYVSPVYAYRSKEQLIKIIEEQGWWYVNGREVEGAVKPLPNVPKTVKKKSVSPMAEVDRAFAESKKQIKL